MTEYKGSGADGNRMMYLEKQRANAQKDLALKKEAISEASKPNVATIDTKFSSSTDVFADQLKRQTIGLVTYQDFSSKRKELELQELDRVVRLEKEAKEDEKRAKKKKKRDLESRTSKSKLSFGCDEEEEEEEDNTFMKKPKLGKNPDVNTSFLPDREREDKEAKMREKIRDQFLKEQEKLKNEDIEVTYSYWDGSGHRRSLMLKKGFTMDKFLDKVRQEFHELRNVSANDLLYIKEDLIIPHHFSFYDLIVTKARGKSGPLFNFDVHDDIRLTSDSRVEKDESHAGKVVERRWYERNKHIFPASRWEVYDPTKDYGSYTIHGHEVDGTEDAPKIGF